MKMRNGFTLAELLLALAIMGVIAMFTIPKILASVTQNNKAGIFKEAIATMSQVVYNGNLTREIQMPDAELYILSHINAVKICNSDSTAEGCYSAAFTPYGPEVNSPGVILHNGAAIIGIDGGWDAGTNQYEDGLFIDWNGDDPPNTHGDDQLWLKICYGPNTCLNNIRPSLMMPFDPPSEQLYADIFTR